MAKEEDLARVDVNSPLSSVIHSSKDDNNGSQFQRLQYQVTKLFKGFSSPPDVQNQNTNYNPEILTTLKRQWAANFQLKYMGHRSWKEPSRLFESMVVVGLHPNCDVQALHRQFVDGKSEGSGKLRSALGCHNQSHVEANIEPQVLFVYPPEKRLPLKCKDLLSFCFPGGLEVRAVERTPSMSELNEIFFGQEHLKQTDLSFVFRLQGADNSTLYGCCVLVEELVQKPSGLLSLISEKQPSYSSLRRYVLTTQRCYCILSRLPFFELHFGVLNSIFTQERLEKLTKSVEESNLEFVEGSYDEENSEGNSESVMVSDGIIEHGFYKEIIDGELRSYKEIIDYDSVVPSEHETDRTTAKEESGPTISEDSDGHPENLMVDGELQSCKERIDYDSVVRTEHETDRAEAKEESGPTISEDSDGPLENLMVDGELRSYKEIIDYDSAVPTEHETDRTTAKEESGHTVSEDSDGHPENLKVDGERQSYKQKIDCDSIVPIEHETDREETKEESGPAISEDSDHQVNLMVDGDLQSYKERKDYGIVVPTEHETDMGAAKEESGPTISEDSDGPLENLMVDGELRSYKEIIDYDSAVPTEHETDRTTAKEESGHTVSEDSDGHPENLKVDGERQSYKQKIDCDSIVPIEHETDREETKEESGPAISEDSDHQVNLMVDGDLQSYKERKDYGIVVPTEHETDMGAAKEESGPTISEDSDGPLENLMVDGELRSYKEIIDYDSAVPTEHETDRTTAKEESGHTVSEDSDGHPENLKVDGERQSYKQKIDCDSIVPIEHETDREETKEESGPAISEDSDHQVNLMVDGDLQSYKERKDYGIVVPTEHETDMGAAKEESGPTISEDSDGPLENLMVDGELRSYKEIIDYDSAVPTEHETDRTTAKEESGHTVSEDSDGHPENLKVDGERQSYKQKIDCDSIVPIEHETDREETKEESGPAISEDSDHQVNLMVEGDLQSYKERIDYDCVVLTEHETGRTAAKEESGPTISEDGDGHLKNLMVDGDLQSYKEKIDYDGVVLTEHETDRTTAKEESGPTISEDSDQYGDAFAAKKELEDRNLPNAVLPLLRYCQYESSESSCSFQASPCEDKNFRNDIDDNETEDASFSGQENLNDLNDILEWAVENDHGPLQIICEYYRISCPSRGSSLTFHPLEHLHPLEYHRPAGTVLCHTNSTVDLKSCSTGLELANANNTLVAEEATSLSVWTIACLCGTLRLENVLTFLAGILLEKQIVVACSNLGILSASVLSVIPLIQPYRWQSLLMTVLPNDMLEFLDAPVPYIVGIKNKTSEVQSKFTNVIVVDANRNQVKSPTIPQLPRQKELISSLRPYHTALVGESYLGRRRPVYECTEVQIGAAKGFLSVLRSYLDSLCYNIRSHTITNVQSNDDKVSLLLKESFIGSFPYRDQPFMKLFIDTQLFSVHTDIVLSSVQKE